MNPVPIVLNNGDLILAFCAYPHYSEKRMINPEKHDIHCHKVLMTKLEDEKWSDLKLIALLRTNYTAEAYYMYASGESSPSIQTAIKC